jgi:hypothetical protein
MSGWRALPVNPHYRRGFENAKELAPQLPNQRELNQKYDIRLYFMLFPAPQKRFVRRAISAELGCSTGTLGQRLPG